MREPRQFPLFEEEVADTWREMEERADEPDEADPGEATVA
jgi:hypothetical protein